MIANVSAHRRANAFAQALEELSDQGKAAEQPEGSVPAPAAEQTEQGRMLALATGLDELPKPVLDPEVKVVHRARLVAAMEAMLRDGALPGREASNPSLPHQKGSAATSAEGRWRETGGRSGKSRGAHRASPLGKLRPRSRLTKGLAAGGLSVGVVASAFGGVAAASSDALPGDSLYGLKRGIEDVKLTLADDSDDRGVLYLDQASTRFSEARRLMERDRGGQLDHESLGEIRRALTGMRHDASEGHRLLHEAFERDPDSLGPIQALSVFSQSHREAWGTLRDRLPVQLGDVSQEVSSVFDAIDEEVAPHSSLLPRPPAQGGDDKQSSTGSGAPGSTDSGRPAPSATGGSVGGSQDTTGKPKPSTSDSGGEGLVGGTTGGLLDPPMDGTTSTSPSTGKSTPADKPDVTLPPLLPGLLPGLGIDSENAN